MSNISQEYWEDVIPGDLEGRTRFYDNLHEFMPGERDPKWGTRKCIAKMYRRDGTEYVCNGSSHSSNHLPIDGCCYCKHGVYLHTSYDISCGRCEAESEYREYEEDYEESIHSDSCVERMYKESGS